MNIFQKITSLLLRRKPPVITLEGFDQIELPLNPMSEEDSDRLAQTVKSLMSSKKQRFKLDTSIAALRELGINLSDDQFHDLSMLNAISRSSIDKDDVVTTILLVLRLVGVLPTNTESKFPMDKLKYL